MLGGKGILTPLQEEFLRIFAELPDQDRFYLTGGTALAEFYLGHRLSFDLDFFTGEEPLILPFSYHLEGVYAGKGWEISVTRRFTTFVEFLVKKGAESFRVDLALDSPFRFEPPLPSVYGVRVNDFTDLKADKVLTYYGRAEPRDAVDLYILLQYAKMDDLLKLAARKDPGFDLYWFAVALNRAGEFPDELNRWPVKVLIDVDPRELKALFQRLAKELLDQITRGT